jgi:hemolysin activation/secretion protein
VGEVDLVLQVTDEVLLTGEVSADNAGARSTGSNRLGVNLQFNSALGMGVLLSVSGVHSEGNDFAHANATLPIGSQGWRGGASVSNLQYKLVSADFAGLNAQGTSTTWGLEASYPLIRQPLRNLYVGANLDHKSFDNQSALSTTSRYTVDVFSLALNGNAYDTVGGGGATVVSLVVSTGNNNLAGSPNQAADALTTRTEGTFTKLRYQLSRRQSLNQDFMLMATLSGQSASKNLDSSERFFLGGASGVRAYPTSEGSGSEGMLANLELQWRLPSGWSLTGLYDWGQVTQYRDSHFAGAPALNEYALQGAGLALGWQSAKGAVLRLTWARRSGDNPNPTANGNDQDGSLTRDRIGFTASMPF